MTKHLTLLLFIGLALGQTFTPITVEKGSNGVIAGEKHILEDSTNDLYDSRVKRKHMEIKTHYEKIYLDKGIPITYLRFHLR